MLTSGAAQRPCSRCLSNGKEDACVDVQHKKRGRPRLRDEREARFDLPRPPVPPESALRRPLSQYTPGPSQSAQYGLPTLQTQPPLEYQSRDQWVPRYPGPSSPLSAGSYGPGLSPVAQLPETAAYLNLNLEVLKASEPFISASGVLRNRWALQEVVAASDIDKVVNLRNQFQVEQRQRDPNYLPPILGRGEHFLQHLGFSAEEVGRFQLDYQGYLTFIASDGQPRTYPVRLGLAKEGTFYFIVLVLVISGRPAYPTISPQERTAPLGFYRGSSPSISSLMHGPQGVPAHDLTRHRLSDVPLPPRPPAGVPPQLVPGPGQAVGPGGPQTTPFPGTSARPEFPAPPLRYPAARSELPPGPQPPPPPRPMYPLPPIRAPQEAESSAGDRSSRVDIGGLLEKKPDTPGRPH